MKVHVESVDVGAEYEDIVYNFWVILRLSNGQIIRVFDLAPFDLRGNIKNEVEVLLVAGFLSAPHDPLSIDAQIIKGTFIGAVELPFWDRTIPEIIRKSMGGIDTENGLFFMYMDEAIEMGLKEQQSVEFEVGRFDLVGVRTWFQGSTITAHGHK